MDTSLFDETQKLDDEIERLLTSLENEDPGAKEYGAMLAQLKTLYAIKDAIAATHLKKLETEARLQDINAASRLKELEAELKTKAANEPKRVSPDVWATIAANLAGILVIVGHEKAHVVTTKALGFILKLR